MRNNKRITKRADKMLTKLADFLENDVMDKVFDLDTFWETDDEDEDDLYSCTTAACACGWAAISPKFRGLSTSPVSYNGAIYHTKSNTYDLEAAGNYFNITEEQAEYLFDPRYYSDVRNGRKSVINRIRKFIKNGGVKGNGAFAQFWLEDYAG